VPRRAPTHIVRHYVTATTSVASSRAAQYGRTAAYQRLVLPNRQSPSSQQSILSISFSPRLFPSNQILLRSLHTSQPQYQKSQPKEEVRDPPRNEQQKQEASEEKDKNEESEGEKDKDEKSDKEGKESKKSEENAPPPPHGDKTPWQVFTDTLRTEFKASKEWNESTKQLSGSVQQFTESEAVRRAREASEAATKGTSQALKSTGRVIGQGAAWTWDTKVVQGIREGVNATGRGIEKATRPVRETKAFKDVSEAIDDGSSSRYGGWTEKEERRKKREARELKDRASGKFPSEPLAEDPK
jgi:import inner membrane translocase subunit TIM44